MKNRNFKKITARDIPDDIEIVNPEQKESANMSFMIGFYPSSKFLIYTRNDDLGEAMDIFADYCEEKGYSGYLGDKQKTEDYENEESEDYIMLQDQYMRAGNHGILIKTPDMVKEIKLKKEANKIAVIANHNNPSLPIKVSLNEINHLYKTAQEAINDCEKNKILYQLKLKKQSDKREPIAPGIDVEIKIDGSGILYVEGKLPILITEDQVKQLTLTDKTASLHKQASLVGKENAGYEIIEERFKENDSDGVGEIYVVLAKNPNAPSPYVTWNWNKQSGFYWGHYISDEKKAKKDFETR